MALKTLGRGSCGGAGGIDASSVAAGAGRSGNRVIGGACAAAALLPTPLAGATNVVAGKPGSPNSDGDDAIGLGSRNPPLLPSAMAVCGLARVDVTCSRAVKLASLS